MRLTRRRICPASLPAKNSKNHSENPYYDGLEHLDQNESAV
jgi:hypothetical protein